MKTVKKIINGREIEFSICKSNTYTQVIALHKGSYIYSVLDGISDTEDEALDNVVTILLNTLK